MGNCEELRGATAYVRSLPKASQGLSVSVTGSARASEKSGAGAPGGGLDTITPNHKFPQSQKAT